MCNMQHFVNDGIIIHHHDLALEDLVLCSEVEEFSNIMLSPELFLAVVDVVLNLPFVGWKH